MFGQTTANGRAMGKGEVGEIQLVFDGTGVMNGPVIAKGAVDKAFI